MMVRRDGAFPVGANDVLLHGPTVADMGDICEAHRRRADLTQRQPIEGVDGLSHRVHADDELRIADLGVAGGQGKALSG